MKRPTVLLMIVLVASMRMSAASVEYSMVPEDVMATDGLEHSYLGGGLYYRNISADNVIVPLTVADVDGALFLRLSLYCITFAGGDPFISDSDDKDYMSVRKGDRVENLRPMDISVAAPVLVIPPSSVGMITGLKGRYYDRLPAPGELEFRFEHEEVFKGYVKATGFGLFRAGSDASVRIEAERAARLDAYRNLKTAVTSIASAEGFVLDEKKMDYSIKGASVIKKEYTDKGVYVTVGLRISGEDGFGSFVKD